MSSSRPESDRQPAVPPASFNDAWLWIAAVVLVVLLRMWLVGSDGIEPQIFDPAAYAQAAAHYANGDGYDRMPAHRPGMPFLARLAAELGIPWKLFTDLLMTVVAGAGGWMLLRLTGSRVVGFVFFLVMMFNPWFMGYARLFMTEALASLWLLVILLSAIPFVCRPPAQWTVWQALSATFFSGGYALVRNETLPLAVFWFLIFVITVLRHRKEILRRPWLQTSAARGRLAMLILPIVGMWIAGKAVSEWNRSQFDVNAVCATEGSGCVALMNALYTIVPDHEMRFAPVLRSTLERAIEVSPAMAQHRDRLLDTSRQAYLSATMILGFEEEIGTFLNWHLIDCFGGFSRGTNQQMLNAAQQIRDAQARGDLARRWARYPMDPMWREWLPEIPSTIWQGLWMSINEPLSSPINHLGRRRVKNSVEQGFFDDGLLRRRSVGEMKTLRVHGLGPYRPSQGTFVRLMTPGLELLQQIPVRHGPDGQAWFSFTADSVTFPKIRGELQLSLVLNSNVSRPVSIAQQARFQRVEFATYPDSPVDMKEIWHVSVSHSPPPSRLTTSLKDQIEIWYWLLVIGMVVVAAGAGWYWGLERSVNDLLWIVAAGVVFWLTRTSFYVLIEVWLHWGLRRYASPNFFFVVFTISCLVFAIAALLRRWKTRRID
ncbi:MAG: hypothetical protein ACR2NP_13510 [Pirellulaceae bacterium]